jgi:biopolymer transport protein ExbD
MRLRERHQALNPEVDMTPMIDMVFQLVAFFMVAINFAAAEQNERIHLPMSELAKPPDVPFESPITLQLTKEGTVLLVGEEVPVVPPGVLRSRLLREKEIIEYHKGKASDVTVVIRADGDAKTGIVQELMEICRNAGFHKFALRAKQEQRT